MSSILALPELPHRELNSQNDHVFWVQCYKSGRVIFFFILLKGGGKAAFEIELEDDVVTTSLRKLKSI